MSLINNKIQEKTMIENKIKELKTELDYYVNSIKDDIVIHVTESREVYDENPHIGNGSDMDFQDFSHLFVTAQIEAGKIKANKIQSELNIYMSRWLEISSQIDKFN